MAPSKRAITVGELLCVIVLLVVLGMLILPGLRGAVETPRGATCQQNLRKWGVIFKMFAQEHGGRYPGRFIDYGASYEPESGFWREPDYMELWPEYLDDMAIILCPDAKAKAPEGWTEVSRGYGYPETTGYRRGIDPSWADAPLDTPAKGLAGRMREAGIGNAEADAMCRDARAENDTYCYWRPLDTSYVYWGWMIAGCQAQSSEDMLELALVVDNDLDRRSPTNLGCNCSHRFQDIDIVLPVYGKTRLYYLREGVEQLFNAGGGSSAGVSLTPADVAVMWDMMDSESGSGALMPKKLLHDPPGSNVLFMDGHVEFGLYPQPAGSRLWMVSQYAMYDEHMWFP